MKKFITLLLVFTMLISVFTMVPVSAKDSGFPFTDVPPKYNTGYQCVKSLWEQGIVSGKTETLFKPDDPLTREEAAKIITLAAKLTPSDKKGTFSDAEPGAWYEPYLETVCEAGLMQGIGDGKFGIGDNITREDAAVLSLRMAEYLGIEIEFITQLDIADITTAAPYAQEAIKTLAAMEVADLTDEKFDPKTPITRMSFCQFVDRLLISDVRAYDDYLQDWMPKEKTIEEYGNEVIAFDDFESDTRALEGYNSLWPSSAPAQEHIVKGEGVDGSKALEIKANEHSNIAFYLYDFEPGVTYYVSYDMKTDGLGSAGYGRFCYEFRHGTVDIQAGYHKNGMVYGTTDWRHQEYSFPAPSPDKPVDYCRLIFRLDNPQSGGKAFIDNFKIYKVVYNPVNTYLRRPAFKGIITDPNGENDIQLTSYITGLGSPYEPEKHELVTTLSDMEGNVVKESRITNPTEEMDITFSSKDLAVGDYTIDIRFLSKETGEEVGVTHHLIRKREPDFTTRFGIDYYGRLLKNGEPWLPMGAYARIVNPSDLLDFKDGPIDFIIENSTSRYWANQYILDEFVKYGMYSMKNEEMLYKNAHRREYQTADITTQASERPVVERHLKSLGLINHPGHIGYEINNEFGHGLFIDRLAWHQEIYSDLDINSLNFGCGSGTETAAIDLSRSHDVFGPDPYPITGDETDEIWTVYEQLKPFADYCFNRPAWSVLQISDLGPTMKGGYSYRKRGPNETELRNMAWQAICAGCQNITWYAHFHLDEKMFPDISRPKAETMPEYFGVTNEVLEFKDAILSVEDAPDVYAKPSIPDRFAHIVKRYDGKTYIFMVNMDKKAQNVSFKLNDVNSVFGAYSNEEYEVGSKGILNISLEGLGVEVLVVDQPEQASPDCKIANMSIYDANNSYYITKTADGNTVYLPEGVNEIFYAAETHPDVKMTIDGAAAELRGKISVAGKDKIEVTVVSEDGVHKNKTIYNIVRKGN